MKYRLRSSTSVLTLATLLPLAAGCASMNKTQKGAVIGAAGGAAAGAAIGAAAGSTAKGAIIGAAVGGTAGAIIGSQMDEQGEELADELENAKVERVGEGLLVTFDSGLLFEFDSDEIQGAARDNLTELAESLKRYPKSDLLIVGHTDSVGTDSYNYDLSRQRAESAEQFLAMQGVDASRIETAGRGETEPVDTNATDAGRAQNRRVEVAIYASEEYREALTKKGN